MLMGWRLSAKVDAKLSEKVLSVIVTAAKQKQAKNERERLFVPATGPVINNRDGFHPILTLEHQPLDPARKISC